MQQFLKYIYYSLRYPELKDYTRMGLGIENREKKLGRFWETHLSCSKEFIEKNLESTSGKTISILGAGRLLDIDLNYLKERFSQIHLYDLDPVVVPIWNKWRSKIPNLQLHHKDLTGVMNEWAEKLKRIDEKNTEELKLYVESLVVKPIAVDSDVIVSLNLLSQLGVYWRDRALKIVPNFPEELLKNSVKKLEASHLCQISKSKKTILIYDSFFYYYKRNIAEWQTENALELEEKFNLENYTLIDSDTWLWHISPQGFETEEYGEIHKVEAKCFQK